MRWPPPASPSDGGVRGVLRRGSCAGALVPVLAQGLLGLAGRAPDPLGVLAAGLGVGEVGGLVDALVHLVAVLTQQTLGLGLEVVEDTHVLLLLGIARDDPVDSRVPGG